MKKITSFLAVIITAFTIAGCQKTPVASLTTDKTEYTAGETIKLTNKSTSGETYKWTFPDGTTGTVENYDYKLIDSDPDATLTFKLVAYSKNGKKMNETSKSVTVKAAKGNVTFWQMSGSGFDITVVSLGGISSNITSEYGGTPDCGAQGCAVFTGLKVGTYNYVASDGTDDWTGSVTVKKDFCTTIELQ